MKTNKLPFTVALFSLFFLFSCQNDKICSDPVDTSLQIDFKTTVNGQAKDSTLRALTFFATKKPDSLLTLFAHTNSIKVPLNPHSDETDFFIQPDSLLLQGDTIKILHQNDLNFVSSGCGFVTIFTIDSISFTRHYIDSVKIPHPKVNTLGGTNIEIYY